MNQKIIIQFKDFSFFYPKPSKTKPILHEINLPIVANKITAIIGPSGCGKTTLLCAINRLNELQNGVNKIKGQVFFDEQPIYSSKTNVVNLRKKIGLVFQKPAPFPMSIYDNIAFALRIHGQHKHDILDQVVQNSLKQVNLWDEVKDRLHSSALDLSGGQQQRLCIARCLANEPEVILMDEPTSALDPISKEKIENLIFFLKKKYTIILVTHSLNQASKVSDYVAFLDAGVLVEYGKTKHVFLQPQTKKMLKYITGKFV